VEKHLIHKDMNKPIRWIEIEISFLNLKDQKYFLIQYVCGTGCQRDANPRCIVLLRAVASENLTVNTSPTGTYSDGINIEATQFDAWIETAALREQRHTKRTSSKHCELGERIETYKNMLKTYKNI
jgi:hypothetical protein